MDKFIVRKSNILLLDAIYALPLNAQKLLTLSASKIDAENDEKFHNVEITVADMEFVTDNMNSYRDLKIVTDQLFEAEFVTFTEDGDPVRNRWVDKATYIDGKGKVQLRFARDVEKYLLMLKENFTEYDVTITKNFNFTHTLRIFEMLITSKEDNEPGEIIIVQLDVDKMKTVLKLKDKYPRYTDFNRFVLKKAYDELVETKSLKNLTMKPIREGRSVKYIEFSYMS